MVSQAHPVEIPSFLLSLHQAVVLVADMVIQAHLEEMVYQAVLAVVVIAKFYQLVAQETLHQHLQVKVTMVE